MTKDEFELQLAQSDKEWHTVAVICFVAGCLIGGVFGGVVIAFLCG